MHKIVILISGRGSNMQAIVNANIANVDVAAVISNQENAAGLAWAREKGITSHALNHRTFANRTAYDAALMTLIDSYSPDLVVLAGFMRILSADFCHHYAGRLMNIHPSLLPAFTGLNTHERALEAGCKITGCSVHFVTADLDGGPIIAQAAVPILDDDTADSLATRVLHCEHRIYPQAIADFCAGYLEIQGQQVINHRAIPDPKSALLV